MKILPRWVTTPTGEENDIGINTEEEIDPDFLAFMEDEEEDPIAQNTKSQRAKVSPQTLPEDSSDDSNEENLLFKIKDSAHGRK
ncbi:hypothetical protein Anas_09092 [Armadillidium nasatum]|uniref:Uncharacterized protein n=1 Tax=Armadillidium nasatum TaxID=96803 RepID=A0A5N5TE38_9CRUS|nr:hypothetical protein Anas_09092 [Armadillidium nasatum]